MAFGFDPAALDRWLTTDPREGEQLAFERWCEENDVGWDDPTAAARFEEWLEEQYEDVPEPPQTWDRDPRDFA